MVDGSAHRDARFFCSCICRERGFVRWRSNRRCVVVQGGRGGCGLMIFRACFVFLRAAVLRFCSPFDRFLSHARYCSWFFECCGCVQRCNGGMVDGSAQRGACLSCSCICRERGFVRWGWQHRQCVAVPGGGVEGCLLLGAFFFAIAAVFWFCLPCDRSLSHARHCRWWYFFCCCGCVQRCNRGMVDGSAQRGAYLFYSCICRERGFVRWG